MTSQELSNVARTLVFKSRIAGSWSDLHINLVYTRQSISCLRRLLACPWTPVSVGLCWFLRRGKKHAGISRRGKNSLPSFPGAENSPSLARAGNRRVVPARDKLGEVVRRAGKTRCKDPKKGWRRRHAERLTIANIVTRASPNIRSYTTPKLTKYIISNHVVHHN